jgi:hypothetical protein
MAKLCYIVTVVNVWYVFDTKDNKLFLIQNAKLARVIFFISYNYITLTGNK